MDSKIIGAQHGAAARAKLKAAGNSATGAAGRSLQRVKQAARYVAGFARGLLLAGNV